MARDLGLVFVRYCGRNFLGTARFGTRGVVARVIDPILRRRSSLCSDICVIGQKAY
jgi:hypothetical protein